MELVTRITVAFAGRATARLTKPSLHPVIAWEYAVRWYPLMTL